MGAGIIVLIMLAALVAWLIVFRPISRRRKVHEAMLRNVEPGMEVLTAGGLYAEVVEVYDEDDELLLEIAPGVNARFDRRAIAMVFPADADVDPAPGPPKSLPPTTG